MNKKFFILGVMSVFGIAACSDNGTGTDANQSANAGTGMAIVAVTEAELGEQLFSDKNLSSNGTQSCASCHAATGAFSDPDKNLPVSEGAVVGRFGTRNAPSAKYMALVPALHQETTVNGPRWVGGIFMDGRVDSLEAQARGPLFNVLEMNLTNAADLHAHLSASPTRVAYEAVYGAGSLADGIDENLLLTRVTDAIATFERSSQLQPFSSKFDAVLAGRATLSVQEAIGRDVFSRPDKGGCAACHVIGPGPAGSAPLFSNFTYENIGVPRNPDRRFYTADFIDTGLEATLLARGIAAGPAANTRGRFRVPSLRNIALTAPYMHNGVFTDLHTVVEFYNTRDTDRARWSAIGATEVPATVNNRIIGNLGLNAQEVDAVVAFLQTLNDGYTPP